MKFKKTFRRIIITLLLALVIFIYFWYFWVFSDGTKAGVLNSIQKTGYVFKTYEGHLIQSGFKTNIQSNEFEFSVIKESVAQILLQNSGREVNLHYIHYLGALPWRGAQSYIVDSVYQVRGNPNDESLSPTLPK